GQVLAVGASGDSADVIDLASGDTLFRTGPGDVSYTDFHVFDGDKSILGVGSESLVVWDWETPAPEGRSTTFGQFIEAAVPSPDFPMIAMKSGGGDLVVVDSGTGNITHYLTPFDPEME